MSDKILEALKEQKELIKSNFTEIEDRVTKIEKATNDLDTRLKETETLTASRRVDLPGLENEKQSFSFLRAINAIRTGDWSQAGFEKEIFDNTRQKAMSVGSDTGGGFLVPSVYITEVIELLRAQSVVIKAGATVMDGLTGSPVEIPKQTGGATAYAMEAIA